MKYVKMLTLAAVAAAALMAFVGAGTASASVLCSSTTSPCPEASKWPNSTLEFSLTTGTSANLKETNAPGGNGEVINTCTSSSVKGALTNGTSSATAKGPVEAKNLTWGGCEFPTTTIKGGTLEVHNISGGTNGTVTGSGFEVTINTIIFGSCVYGTGENKDLGKLTEGKPAVFHAEAVVTRLSGSQLVCPEDAEWSATYTLTSQSGTTLAVTAS